VDVWVYVERNEEKYRTQRSTGIGTSQLGDEGGQIKIVWMC